MRVAQSAVKSFAAGRGYEIFQPASLSDPQVLMRLRAAQPDVLVVAAYGLLIPPPLLALPRHGAINIHASLLPRWRGAAPVQRALLAGDRDTGVSIMQMDAGLDTGPLLATRRVPIAADDDAGSLESKLAEEGADTLLEVLAGLQARRAQPKPQAQTGVTYARKIGKGDTVIDWKRPAAELERAIRAFRPSPGAVATIAGMATKLWRARVLERAGVPGTVLAVKDTLDVACGQGALAIEELQPAGGKRMPAAQFLRGRPLAAGMQFE